MKADFDVHEGTFLLYPTRTDVWRKGAEPMAKTLLALAKEISSFESVKLGVPASVKASIPTIPSVDVLPMQYNDIWVRDSGGVPVGTDLTAFAFNAWGGEEGLYEDYADDQTVPLQMSKILQKKLHRSPLTLEGGNLAVNGKGTLVAIKNTVCNKNRNPSFTQEEIEERLKQALRVEKIIWIEEGLVYDETGGHIDNLAAFADEETVLLAWTEEKESPQYERVRRALHTLQTEKGAKGESFRIVKVPLPKTFARTEEDCEGLTYSSESKNRLLGEKIQPSYVNFIFVNGGVIVPSFEDSRDQEVLELFTKVFPTRKVVQFPAREVVLGGGGLHCITKNY